MSVGSSVPLSKWAPPDGDTLCYIDALLNDRFRYQGGSDQVAENHLILHILCYIETVRRDGPVLQDPRMDRSDPANWYINFLLRAPSDCLSELFTITDGEYLDRVKWFYISEDGPSGYLWEWLEFIREAKGLPRGPTTYEFDGEVK